MAKTSTNDGLLTTAKAADLAGMSRQALEGHIAAGRIQPAVTIGKLRFFSRASIDQWLQDRKKQGVAKRGPRPQKNGNKK